MHFNPKETLFSSSPRYIVYLSNELVDKLQEVLVFPDTKIITNNGSRIHLKTLRQEAQEEDFTVNIDADDEGAAAIGAQ